MDVFTWGTLGDSYIQMLKIRCIKDNVRVFHYCGNHDYWRSDIEKILRLAPNVKDVVFERRYDLPEITTDTHEQEMEFFPNLHTELWEAVDESLRWLLSAKYTVFQCHSGKPKGGNTKNINPDYIRSYIKNNKDKNIVLLGTNRELYGDITSTLNLVGRTDIITAMALVGGADEFIGAEGLLSFVALSHRVKSDVFYISQDAVERRIVGTPWEQYANLIGVYHGNSFWVW
ncbi:hypothetical protein DRJ17_06695 [Candidatus Woesearchaeota archaeon]|nr:MAG: hypothetical protein DRJ17_06695 [Candidatus Woesearchaeota archaeon]